MRIKAHPDYTTDVGLIIDRPAVGYTMWLSANDTRDWADRPGGVWPGSTLGGHRLRIEVDRKGLADLAADGKADQHWVDAWELDAIITDHLPAHLRHLWPVWDF